MENVDECIRQGSVSTAGKPRQTFPLRAVIEWIKLRCLQRLTHCCIVEKKKSLYENNWMAFSVFLFVYLLGRHMEKRMKMRTKKVINTDKTVVHTG